MIKRILIPLLAVGVALGGVTFVRAQSSAKDDVKTAAKKTGRAIKKGTKKGVHAGAKVTRKGAGKIEKKTARRP